jgi:hypothetical protein
MLKMARVFDGMGENAPALSQQHVETENLPGIVRVVVDESADQMGVVNTLLRIASWIENEAKLAASGGHPVEPPEVGGE